MSHLGVAFNVLQKFSFRDAVLGHRGIHHQRGSLAIQMIKAEMCLFVSDLRDFLSILLIENSLKRHAHLLINRLDYLLNSYIVKEHARHAPMPTIQTKISNTHTRTKINK